jgi:hypothetical protein
MTGEVEIDGWSISEIYGFVIGDGSYENLVQFPPLKPPKVNNWIEENGIDVDLTAPKLAANDIEIKFVSVSRTSNLPGLIWLLETTISTNKAYHSFNFIDLGITKSLRLLEHSANVGTNSHLRQITLRFSDDLPFNDYDPISPESTITRNTVYAIDSAPFTDYNVLILEGTDEEITKEPPVKENLKVDISIENGVTYDPKNVTWDAKDVNIKCLMLATSNTQFGRNLNALLYQLIQPDLHVFGFGNEDYDFYYKSMRVDRFTTYKGNGIWCEFTLVLCFTNYKGTGSYIP